jgi:hypothetical protein
LVIVEDCAAEDAEADSGAANHSSPDDERGSVAFFRRPDWPVVYQQPTSSEMLMRGSRKQEADVARHADDSCKKRKSTVRG